MNILIRLLKKLLELVLQISKYCTVFPWTGVTPNFQTIFSDIFRYCDFWVSIVLPMNHGRVSARKRSTLVHCFDIQSGVPRLQEKSSVVAVSWMDVVICCFCVLLDRCVIVTRAAGTMFGTTRIPWALVFSDVREWAGSRGTLLCRWSHILLGEVCTQGHTTTVFSQML